MNVATSLRAPLKRILSGTPIYGMAKRRWDRLKKGIDHRAFAARYPDADYVHYSPQQLQAFRSKGFHSQFGQDHYFWTRVLKAQAAGFFVDIGANHPRHNSNSLYLEQQGWSGMAFDPLTSLLPLWKEQRRTDLRNVAITATRERRRFVEFRSTQGWENQLSGFEEFVRPDDAAVHAHETYEIDCAPLVDFVDDRQIDILFIDVEGAELLVLAGIDFDRVRPRHIMIENMREPGGEEEMRKIIQAAGYRLIARIGATDDLFERIA